MLALLLACAGPPDTGKPEVPAECVAVTTDAAPTTVLLLSLDTVHRDFLGVHHPAWDVTPRLDALFAEGARLDHVIVPRGLSAPSMASMVTGAYPRTHGVRVNDRTLDPEGVSADTPTLGQRF
ncbi:MAG: alkaline phosphatase family protein, partial [Myxococcota bacterium]